LSVALLIKGEEWWRWHGAGWSLFSGQGVQSHRGHLNSLFCALMPLSLFIKYFFNFKIEH